ncbi:MAG: PEP-CTERM sorting domain-containing protein [Deltaproteobacteria bacterium]|nr:PEP-CTERM sorting domain-containing protein [Deltaproteobacteria bacterium]
MAAMLLLAAPSFATSFTVLGWDAGEVVRVTFNSQARSFTTTQFHEQVDGVTGVSFCADLSQYITTATYTDFVAHDPAAAESQAFASGPPVRKFAWAAQIADRWANDLNELVTTLGVTNKQAITGVQAAIWEAVYGNAFTATAASMSGGAWSVYQHVLGHKYASYGRTLLYHSPTKQDQLFTPPVPEPSAMFVFGAGALLVGRSLLRRKAE